MNPINNLDKLLNALNQLDNINIVKGKGSADALQQINTLVDQSIQDLKEALLNPTLSKKELEDLSSKAKVVQLKLTDLEHLSEGVEKRNNREVATAINTLIDKSKVIKQVIQQHTLNAMHPLPKTPSPPLPTNRPPDQIPNQKLPPLPKSTPPPLPTNRPPDQIPNQKLPPLPKSPPPPLPTKRPPDSLSDRDKS